MASRQGRWRFDPCRVRPATSSSARESPADERDLGHATLSNHRSDQRVQRLNLILRDDDEGWRRIGQIRELD